jgi:CheY-like chemotaxis protein
VRNELLRFVESLDAATVARFFNALGLNLTVLSRVTAHEPGKPDAAQRLKRLSAFNEMQHACFGQVNAFLHDVADLFPAHASVSILYHFAHEARIVPQLEQAFSHARKLAMQGQAPTPSEREHRVLLVSSDPQVRAAAFRILGSTCMLVEAEDPADALDKAEWVEPQLIIMDAQVAPNATAAVVTSLRAARQGTSFILLSDDDETAGCDAVLKRNPTDNDLRQATGALLGRP